MFLLYLDESGVTHRHPEQTSHYVTLGVAVHEDAWYTLENKVAKVRKQFGLSKGTELHAKWILRRYPVQERIVGFSDLSWQARRQAVLTARDQALDGYTNPKRQRKANEYRHTEPFVHLTRQERSGLVEAALEIVGTYPQGKLYLFGEAINKRLWERGLILSKKASITSSPGSSVFCESGSLHPTDFSWSITTTLRRRCCLGCCSSTRRLEPVGRT